MMPALTNIIPYASDLHMGYGKQMEVEIPTSHSIGLNPFSYKPSPTQWMRRQAHLHDYHHPNHPIRHYHQCDRHLYRHRHYHAITIHNLLFEIEYSKSHEAWWFIFREIGSKLQEDCSKSSSVELVELSEFWKF